MTLNPLLDKVDCKECKEGLQKRIKDVVSQWASEKVRELCLSYSVCVLTCPDGELHSLRSLALLRAPHLAKCSMSHAHMGPLHLLILVLACSSGAQNVDHSGPTLSSLTFGYHSTLFENTRPSPTPTQGILIVYLPCSCLILFVLTDCFEWWRRKVCKRCGQVTGIPKYGYLYLVLDL